MACLGQPVSPNLAWPRQCFKVRPHARDTCLEKQSADLSWFQTAVAAHHLGKTRRAEDARARPSSGAVPVCNSLDALWLRLCLLLPLLAHCRLLVCQLMTIWPHLHKYHIKVFY
jgi:hypothetical protein